MKKTSYLLVHNVCFLDSTNKLAIEPVAANTMLAVEYRKNASREDYQTLLLTPRVSLKTTFLF